MCIRDSATTVNALVNEEISLHVKLCAEEGIEEADLFNATEAMPNLAYTRYVLDAGHSGDFLDLIAALAPCVLGYGEIGYTISKKEHSSAFPIGFRPIVLKSIRVFVSMWVN